MSKDQANTKATESATPASRPGPPAGPKVRFLLTDQPFQRGDVTDRFPFDSCERLIAERKVEYVDQKEADDYRRAHQARVAAAEERERKRAAEEKARIEERQRQIAGSANRMMNPADTVTK